MRSGDVGRHRESIVVRKGSNVRFGNDFFYGCLHNAGVFDDAGAGVFLRRTFAA